MSLYPDFIPEPQTAQIARMWSRRLHHVRGFNQNRAHSLARKVDWYRRSGDARGLRMFLAEYDHAMAQAIGTAYRFSARFDEIVRAGELLPVLVERIKAKIEGKLT